MGMYNIQVPPVGMRIPITPNAKATSSIPRKKSKDGSRVEQTMNEQDEIKELKQRIAELEEQVEQEQVFPQEGDTFWFLNTYGVVMGRDFKKDSVDSKILKSNIFETQQEAEYAREKLKVEAELRKFSRPFEYGKFNYYLFFDIDGNSFRTDFTSYCPPQGAIYFESEEKAQQAIKSAGEERIKKYIFGVRD